MTDALIDRNPEILVGTPMFAGTRIPVCILMEHLEAGDRLDDYPTVSRRQAVVLLECATAVMLSRHPMKLLLDESVPRRLAVFFPESYIVREEEEFATCSTS